MHNWKEKKYDEMSVNLSQIYYLYVCYLIKLSIKFIHSI